MSVFIGMPVHGRIPGATARSLFRTALACGENGIGVQWHQEGISPAHWARDCVLAKFLETDAQKLFWIDSDMVWEPESFLRFLALSQHRQVVGASYPSRSDAQLYMINGTGSNETSDEFGLIKVGGFGLGFTIMDRSVCEALAKGAHVSHINVAAGKDAPEIFKYDTLSNNDRRGEDMAFFADIRALGTPVYLDPSIYLGHVGEKVWFGRAGDHLKPKEP